MFRDEVRGSAVIHFEEADQVLRTATRHPVTSYHLHADDLEITIDCADPKAPVMVYVTPGREERYHGKSLYVDKSPVGTLYSAAIEVIPDLHSIFFTVMVPEANCPENARSVSIETLAIQTLSQTHFAGPAVIDGQVQKYKTIHLTGIA